MKYTIFAIILGFFATIKVIADIAGFTAISAIAAVTNLSPAMKVFTAHKGYETYSSRFELHIEYRDKQTETRQLTPSNYSSLQGPYNRRNVYGALIAYGPVLVRNSHTKPMWETMSSRAFCHEPSVLHELGFSQSSGIKSAVIRYLDQTQTSGGYASQLRIDCE